MLTSDDPLIIWAADQPGARVFTRPGAVAVVCPDLARHDRMPVHGDPGAVAALLREVLPLAGPTFRPLGDESLMTAVAERLPMIEVAGRFGWMDTATAPSATAGQQPHWLGSGELPEVTALLDEASPETYARPGGSGVARWAGVRDADGTLLAVAADAWSSGRVGFLAGVATAERARGRGLAAALCAFVTRELLVGRDRVALFVDHWNSAALATYKKLGFALRPVAAARRS
ncbi:GNAT family N-acetyltransferase [Paractinoplanes atraurantiacus]|uniref:Acetyltransferase (GNAT) family protein n=1 Tax=Paractinoplanes atraurantiacus TaxID=1036182 RepID=A0A285J813_9ACTN|nr:GNAT family N-acetyltransferase [Actinoplanes atraurantiacus]SNY56414.1 Acetyltransferase (GNAT) family protein [Actinoplanes atraurantiacus]